MGLIDQNPLIQSILTGLSASSGTAKYVTVTSSAIIGVFAAILYQENVRLFERTEIDDPF